MSSTSYDERRKVNHELKKLGFGGLEDPNLIPQLGFTMRDHNHFRGLLMSVKPEQRAHAYRVLRPHLRFAAKPLDVYVAEAKQQAEEQQTPYYDPNTGNLIPMKKTNISEIAEQAIAQMAHERAGGVLTLVCSKCTVEGAFRSTDRKQASRESQTAGWRTDYEKTYCPKCVPTRCTMSLDCARCDKHEDIRCWDPQDGYSSARIRGWKIDDSALCPECAMQTLTLQ